jgi:hypothetical protein
VESVQLHIFWRSVVLLSAEVATASQTTVPRELATSAVITVPGIMRSLYRFMT